MEAFSAIEDPATRYKNSARASRNAQLSSQITGYSNVDDAPGIAQLTAKYGIKTQSQAGVWQRMNQTVSNFQNTPITMQQQEQMVSMSSNLSPYVGGFVSQLGNLGWRGRLQPDGGDADRFEHGHVLAGVDRDRQFDVGRYAPGFLLGQSGQARPEVRPVRHLRQSDVGNERRESDGCFGSLGWTDNSKLDQRRRDCRGRQVCSRSKPGLWQRYGLALLEHDQSRDPRRLHGEGYARILRHWLAGTRHRLKWPRLASRCASSLFRKTSCGVVDRTGRTLAPVQCGTCRTARLPCSTSSNRPTSTRAPLR